MGDLPAERVTTSPPFYFVGIDYCGPFLAHFRLGGKQPTKTYLCIFISFVSKAMHLEMASGLSANAFMGALRRFVATRGILRHIVSDNATNFTGANSKLNELYDLMSSDQLRDNLREFCHEDRIEWSFLPPYSPNFGGLHEAAVKLTKFHLRRTIGSSKFTLEQLMTVIKDVEAILNSRPLTPLSSSPDDLHVLTPGHLLIGRPLTSLPTPELCERPPLETWRQIDQVKQAFWKRWSSEYLRAQQQRYKWQKTTQNIRINELVVLIDNNLPPLCWKMGRVIETYTGDDGLVRVVKIKTSSGEHKRGVSKICRFPPTVETDDTFQGGENVETSTN